MLLALVLAILFRRQLDPHQKAIVGRLVGAALTVSLLLVYGLALDPKPRMFLGLLVASSIAAGAMAGAAWRTGQVRLMALLTGLCVACGIAFLWLTPTRLAAEARAAQWAVQYPSEIEVDDATRENLRMVAAVRALPRAGTGHPLRIAATSGNCATLVAGAPGSRPRATVVAVEGGRDPEAGELCLLRYLRQQPGGPA